MTWPSSDVNTTALDGGTDTPPRAEFNSWADKFNQMRNHVSAFMQGLLDDADASTAQTTLGGTTVGKALFTAASAAAARAAIKGVGLPSYKTGYLYPGVNGWAHASSYLTMTAGYVYYAPWLQRETRAMAAVAFLAQATHASSVRVGLYADNGGAPGALIATIGTVSLASLSGIRELAYTTEIPAGMYWIALHTEGACSLRICRSSPNTAEDPVICGGELANMTPTNVLSYATEAQAYASGLPANFGGTVIAGGTTLNVAVAMRA